MMSSPYGPVWVPLANIGALRKCLGLLDYINVEPTQFFGFMGIEIASFLVKNLYIQKVCRNNATEAPDMKTQCEDENRALAFVSTVFNNALLPAMALSLIFTFFASMYSDIAGKRRKMFVILALIGMMFWIASCIVQSVFWSIDPVVGIIVNILLMDTFGGYLSLQNFMYSHVFDNTSNENRLIKLTVVGVVHNLASFLGKGSAGFLLREYGFTASFFICFFLIWLALGSTIVFIREERRIFGHVIKYHDILNWYQIKRTFKIILWPDVRKEYRQCIWVLLTIIFLLFVALFGEQSVFYYYYRKRFSKNEADFSLLTACRTFSGMIGGLICTLVMSKWLNIHDAALGAFASFFDILAAVGFFVARREWQLYLSVLLDIFHGVALSCCSSLLSKFFSGSEFGRLNIVKMVFISFGIIGVPVYTFLFNYLIKTLPNGFFLLSIAVNLIVFVLYCKALQFSKNIQGPRRNFGVRMAGEVVNVYECD